MNASLGIADIPMRRELREVSDPTGHAVVALELHLSTPASVHLLNTLEQERSFLTSPVEGLRAPYSLAADAMQITIFLEAWAEDVIPLGTLLGGLARDGSPLGSLASAYVAAAVARVADSVHRAPTVQPGGRVLHALDPWSISLMRNGAVEIFGSGLQAVDSLLRPQSVVRPGPPDKRDDVHAIGALYVHALSGAPSEPSMLQNLGSALPDPRPSLVNLLTRALHPDPAQRWASAGLLAEEIEAEAVKAGLDDEPQRMLARLIAEFVDPRLICDPGLMLLQKERHYPRPTAETTPSELPAPIPIPSGVPEPAHAEVGAPGPGWSEILPDLDEPKSDDAPGRTPSPRPTIPASRLPRPISKPASAPNPILTLDRPKSRPQAPIEAPKSPWGGRILLAIVLLGLGAAGYALFLAPSGPNAPGTATAEPAPPTAPPPQKKATPVPPPPPKKVTEPRRPRRRYSGKAKAAMQGARKNDAPSRKDKRTAKSKRKARTRAGKSSKGLLSVLSQPSGAAVEVDGGYVGKTPLILRHEFEDREYEIRVVREGHPPWVKKLAPDPETRSISIVAKLEPETEP